MKDISNHCKHGSRLMIFLLLTLIMISLGITPITAQESTSNLKSEEEMILKQDSASLESSKSYPHIYDEAGLLSTLEYEELEKMCTEYGEEAGIEIFILTHKNPHALDADTYIEEFEAQLEAGDRVLLLVDMYHREVVIHGYGLAQTYIHSKRIDLILEEVGPNLTNEEYVKAFKTYIKMSANYMKDDSQINTDHNYVYPEYQNSSKDLFTNVWFQLIVSLILGAVVVGIMAYHSSGKMTAGSANYLDPKNSGLIGRRDYYLRTHVTRVRKPKENHNHHRGGSNSGGFRGGVSSAGRSHSSGSRKF